MSDGNLQSSQAAGTRETTISASAAARVARRGEARQRSSILAGQRRDVHPPAAETEVNPADDAASGASDPTALEPHDPLLWRVMISALYHQKRERFLDGVDRCSQAIGMLGGAAAFASAFSASSSAIPGAIVAVVGAGALCYGPGAKARRHAELARDYKSLQAAIVRCGAPLAGQQRRDFEAQVLLLEANEPAALGALVTQCHNELSVAFDRAHAVSPLKWNERLFANWFDLDQTP